MPVEATAILPSLFPNRERVRNPKRGRAIININIKLKFKF
jgi:hypothetical protein